MARDAIFRGAVYCPTCGERVIGHISIGKVEMSGSVLRLYPSLESQTVEHTCMAVAGTPPEAPIPPP